MQKKPLILVLLISCSAGLFSANAQALLFHQSLDFTAPSQSLWGSGGSAGFEYGGDWGFSVLGVDVDLGYSLGANSGSTSAQFNGDMVVEYSSVPVGGGVTNLNFSFLGDPGGGLLKSDLGAWAKATLGFTVGRDYGLNIDKEFTPELDKLVKGSDSTTALTITVVELLAARAGVDFDVQQTINFMATSIAGDLMYTRRGSGVNHSIPFTLEMDAGLSSIPVNLGESGTWDFWFEDQTLNNQFSTSLDLALVLFEEHAEVEFCDGPFGIPYPCGTRWGRNDRAPVDVSVYDPDPFALDFNTISMLDGFSIRVLDAPIEENPDPDTGGGAAFQSQAHLRWSVLHSWGWPGRVVVS